MSEVLNNEERTETGTKRMRRLRQAGYTPAVLYAEGGAASVHLSIPTKEINAAIRHGSHIVKLAGKVNTDALIKDVQWDMLGRDVLHIDFTSVDLSELITVSIPIEMVGVAPGTKTGGVLKQHLQEVEIECPGNAMPDKIEVKINDLDLNQSITAGDLVLPEDARVTCEASEVVVSCSEPVATADAGDEEAGDSPAEPEVIGRKADDEESSDE